MLAKMRKTLSIIAMEFIYGGHLLSIGSSGIVLAVVFLLNLPFRALLLLIPYLSSQVVYTYNHYRELNFDQDSNPERAVHIRGQKKWVVLLLISYATALLIFLLFTNLSTFIFISVVVIFGILYTEYFKELTIKSIAGFKNFYTSFFWAVSVFLVPFFYGLNINVALFYISLFVFLRWIVNSAFFDIKDMESDKQRNLKTFAVILGKRRTIYLLQVINIISVIPLFIGIYNSIIELEAIFLGALVLYGFYYLTYALSIDGKKLRALSYVVVDAEYLFWPILVFMGKVFIK